MTGTKPLNQIPDPLRHGCRWNESQEQSVSRLGRGLRFKSLKNKLFGHDLNLITQ